jgi:hypothetical protein
MEIVQKFVLLIIKMNAHQNIVQYRKVHCYKTV